MTKTSSQFDDRDFIDLLKFEKRPFRSKFIPSKIYGQLDKYRNDAVGLSKYLSKFKISVNQKHLCDAVAIAGEFCEDEGILLHVCGDFKHYQFDNDEWDMFKFRLLQCVMHELIHWSQYASHEPNKTYKYTSNHPAAEYYSSSDEIEAFAHCIYLEIKRDFPNYKVAKVMKAFQSETHHTIFTETFDNDVSNLALRRYKKMILNWEKIYSGKSDT